LSIQERRLDLSRLGGQGYLRHIVVNLLNGPGALGLLLDDPLGLLPVGDRTERIEAVGNGELLLDSLRFRKLTEQNSPAKFILPELQLQQVEPPPRFRDLPLLPIQVVLEALHR